MILLLAVASGLLAGWLRATIRGRRLAAPNLFLLWLLVAAFVLQAIAFQLPTRKLLPDQIASIFLCVSQGMMLIFAMSNRRLPGFWMLIVGLAMNLGAIALNGGFMPISPETIQKLVPNAPPGSWEIGQRFGTGKDIVLPVGKTILWILSDRFLLPEWMPYHVAFSLGDVVISIGAFLTLWSAAGPETPKDK